MLKALRRKFVLIIMVLVGAVLASVLGWAYLSTWQTQHEIVEFALDRGIHGNLRDIPRIGTDHATDAQHEPQRANMLVLSVDLDENGIVLAMNDAPVSIDAATLSDIIANAIEGDDTMGWDQDLHLAWQRTQRDSGAWRVAIADTSAIDITLKTLAFRCVVIMLVAMVTLLGISVVLSAWVLRPVEQAWEQQRRFVADASHELKTPLAVIIANTQILEKDTSLSAESRRWLQSTSDESAHMEGLVEELLELARTDETTAGAQGVMQRVPVDFSSMVENAALEFEAIAFEHETLMDEHVEEGLTVTGDPEWLSRLCKILIDNACKYAYAGTTVTVSLAREGRRCTLSVNNRGNTIDAQDLPHVFDRFYRTDKARSRDAKTGGFGLGLAIAKGVAVSHNGTIAVTSSEQAGTTFTVSLPLAG